ncbi:FAD-binding oxidoreductase [Rhodobacteraceae bacterium W635]|uniref:FAD-binding oxidoreductase n=1 Tax=Nioella halotolerans TaxID=2303578 RepID=UPI000E3E664A|nr:FAD-binding oxidoreductase [Rhodobacteraceae bacterium W635]
MQLSGWGNFPKAEARVRAPRKEAELADHVAEGSAIARGNGRSYGDSAISPRNTIDMRHFDRMLSFNPATGQLVAEAGVMLADVIDCFLPRGWFPMVTPGTKLITLGGAIAADVHGKNHHLDGSFRACVDWIDVMGPRGEVTRCSRDENADLFEWTLGGMGLTGVILRCAVRLRAVKSGWIRQEMIPADNLAAAMDAFEANMGATYSVAWIDCAAKGDHLGRSLVMLGEHADPGEVPPRYRATPFKAPRHRNIPFPINAPGFALNPLTVRAFNAAYYRNGARQKGTRIVDWDGYFYPLDAIGNWNRLYGRRGFMQFQCVIPQDTAREGMQRLLSAISASGQASFLSVLKRFGPQDSAFSFPMAGYTLALDFPRSKAAIALMPELDAITLDHGGRFYLAKDSRMPAEILAGSDPRAEAFATWRRDRGLSASFASLQSERLNL